MNQQICLVPKLSGLGGTSSFQAKLIQGLNTRDIPYSFNLMHPGNTAVLVVGGTRKLWKLWRVKQRGVRIVQRLDGMNWMHRVEKTSLGFFLRSEINNRILAFIRRHLADYIVYQSDFSRDWWDRVYNKRPTPHQVTFNGVDLEQYSPIGPESPPMDHYRILLVEGRLIGAYARGLHMAINLANALRSEYDLTVELMVVGLVSDALKARAHTMAPNLWITWGGVVPREDIPAIDRTAHVLFSTDLNAACPNSVIEAMACGLPVLAYDTGALAEIVQNGSGEVIPYGADHWQLEDPQVPPLAKACLKILQDNLTYRRHARARAETVFGLDEMVTGYLTALESK
jgi:glycosyltransferase involved in cell wall biosynthesis